MSIFLCVTASAAGRFDQLDNLEVEMCYSCLNVGVKKRGNFTELEHCNWPHVGVISNIPQYVKQTPRGELCTENILRAPHGSWVIGHNTKCFISRQSEVLLVTFFTMLRTCVPKILHLMVQKLFLKGNLRTKNI